MTHRETFLAALQCQPVSQMPFVFTVDWFNYPVGTPKELVEPFDWIKMGRYLGGYVHERIAPGVVASANREVTFAETKLEDGDLLHEYTTPIGKLQARMRPSQEANTTFLIGHCVTTPQDYETLMALVADPVYSVDAAGVEATAEHLALIGDDGITYAAGPATPIMDLTRTWVGLEEFVMDLADHQELVEKTMDLMAQRAYEQYELLAANTPARVIVYWDDVTTSYISPTLFCRYVLPVYRNFADICHAHGKLLVMHACGRIRDFLPIMSETGIDAIDWVTPPDTGDVVFAEAQQVMGNKVCVMGTVLPSVMRFGLVADVEAHVHEVLKGVDTRRGFVFMVPPPGGTPMANAMKVNEMVEKEYWNGRDEGGGSRTPR
jgi:hypothetical protein